MDDPDRSSDDFGAEKHSQARQLADKALRLEAEGDQDGADRLFDEAQRTDPEALAAALDQALTNRPATVDSAGDDNEVARMSRDVGPDMAAPGRAGVTGSGSGADGV
jgi:hypothetical protein